MTRKQRREFMAPIVSIVPVRWNPIFSTAVPEIVGFMLGRISALLTSSVDITVRFEDLPISTITHRNAPRVKAAQDGLPDLLVQLADSSYDSVPIVCGRNDVGCAVWDGHHRLRTYELVGRSTVPALIADFCDGSGSLHISG